MPEEAANQHAEKQVREAVQRTEDRAALERQKALESVNEKVRVSVRERETELLAERGKGLQELAAERKQAAVSIQSAGRDAAAKWDTPKHDAISSP